MLKKTKKLQRDKKKTKGQGGSPPRSKSKFLYAPAAASAVVYSEPLPASWTRVQHREFAETLVAGSSSSWHLVSPSGDEPGLDLNPSCSNLFPWLARIAACYERFRFDFIKVSLVSSVPTSAEGRVYMAVDYDYDDTVPVSKAQMMTNATAVEGPIWATLELRLPSSRLHGDQPWKYVSSLGRPNFVEPRTAFCGFLCVAVETSFVDPKFDLIVEYCCELSIPTLEPSAIVDTYDAGTPAIVTVNPFRAIAGIINGSEVWDDQTGGNMLSQEGQIRRITPGTQNYPQIGYTNPVTLVTDMFRTALDLGQARSKGTLLANYTFNGAGADATKTPADLLNTYEPYMQFHVYDKMGAPLGIADHTDLSKVTHATSGPIAPDKFSLAGQALDAAAGIALEVLYATYPTARFIVPFLRTKASTAIGAAIKQGITYIR